MDKIVETARKAPAGPAAVHAVVLRMLNALLHHVHRVLFAPYATATAVIVERYVVLLLHSADVHPPAILWPLLDVRNPPTPHP